GLCRSPIRQNPCPKLPTRDLLIARQREPPRHPDREANRSLRCRRVLLPQEPCAQRPPHTSPAGPSLLAVDKHWFETFVGDKPPSVKQTGLNIIGLQPGVVLENRPGRIARREHSQHMLYCQPPSANDRFAPKDLWVHGNPL